MNQEVWTIKDVLAWTSQKFAEKKFESPLVDAQILLEHVLNLTRVQLYMYNERPLLTSERETFRAAVKRRLHGEPVAYIVGKKYWHDFDLYVDSRVLIPRPETETLFDFVKRTCRHFSHEPKFILDLCTGSGCLALALAKTYPSARVLAVDISQDALDVAVLNFKKYELNQIEFLLGDVTKKSLFDYIRTQFGACDILVSNPPYLPNNDLSWQQGTLFEPKVALAGGESGLELPKQMIQNIISSEILADESFMLVELGEGQPSQFLVEKNQVLASEDSLESFPKDTLFSLRDLAMRERFLGKMKLTKAIIGVEA